VLHLDVLAPQPAAIVLQMLWLVVGLQALQNEISETIIHHYLRILTAFLRGFDSLSALLEDFLSLGLAQVYHELFPVLANLVVLFHVGKYYNRQHCEASAISLA
jgi:hypothetical protein